MRGPAAGDAELALLAERDYLAYASEFAAAPGVSIARSNQFMARRGDLPDPYLNLVLGTWSEDAVVRDVIDEVRALLGGPDRPFSWSLWPSNRPTDLGAALEAAGFRYEGGGPLMALELDTADLEERPPRELAVEPARDVADFRASSRVTLSMIEDPATATVYEAAYEAMQFGARPSMSVFLGRVDGEVVASSALFWATGLAGIYGVGTVEAARGRGYGRAVTLAALRRGRELGLRTAALLSSELGLPVYRRLGFRAVGSVDFYASPSNPSTSASSP